MATNDFLPFATSVDAAVDSQAVWASESGYRPDGYGSGILAKERLNKALRQSTVAASVLMSVVGSILDQDTLDNGDIETLRTQVANALGGAFDPEINYVQGTLSWSDRLNAVKPEWWVATGASEQEALQQAINFACASETTRAVQLNDFYTTAVPLEMPTEANGCLIFGAQRTSGIKYTGTSGALFTAYSTRGFALDNVTLVGPGSSVETSGLVTRTTNPSVGVFYCAFTRMTFEGFQVAMDLEGLCEFACSDIKIGLSKSGRFTGSDVEATPLIGLRIGTTMLVCQFRNMVIFARQRCVEQKTGAQLVEGLKFSGCTFDLSFNDGTNTNQSNIYWESGQDISFSDACWFTNSQKYPGHPAPSYSDNMFNLQHNKGTINAPLASFAIRDCIFFGNGLNFVGDGSVDNGVTFCDNTLYLYSDLGNVKFTNITEGLLVNDNTFRLVGADDGGGKYNLNAAPVVFTGCTHGKVADNSMQGRGRALNTVVNGYMVATNCNDFDFDDNKFVVQDSLPPGSEIVVSGTYSDVVVRGNQQLQASMLMAAIANGTYTTGQTLASINTHLSKPRRVTIDIYIDLVNITNPGGTDMYFRIDGVAIDADKYQRVTTLGTQTIHRAITTVVSGTVALVVHQSLSAAVNANYAQLKITFI